MRHMLGNLSPNYFERTKRYMMLRASQQGTDLTVSGTPPLFLPNSLGKPLKAWEVDVLPKQDLHGYDAPWPAGGGNNKLNPLTVDDANKYIDSDNGNTSDPSATGGLWRASDYIPVTAGDVLFFGEIFSIASIAGSAWYGSNKTFVSGFSATTLKTNNGVITVPNGVSYLRHSWRIDEGYNTNWETTVYITLNSNPHEFSPYSNICPIYGTDKLTMFVEESYDPSATPKAVLTLPQTVYTGTIGSDGGESRWGEVDLGDLAWEYIGSSKKYFQTNSIKNIVKPPVTGSTVVDAMCEAYKMVSWNATTYATGLMAIAGADNQDPGRLSCINTNYTDVASFAAAMRGIKLVFELKTPTTFAVPSVTIPTPKGTATTWATAEDGTVDGMEVTYVGKA